MKFNKLEKSLNKQETVVKPFIYTKPSISEVCLKIFFLLLIQFLCLIATKSYNAVFVVIVSLAGASVAAILNYIIYREPFYTNLTILIQGILIGMLLPESYPLVAVFSISFISLFISRSMIFKSVNSWINETAVAVIIAWFIGNTFFPSFMITPEILALKNPSVYLIENGNFPVYRLDHIIITFLNDKVFDFIKVSVPEGLLSLLWDTHSVIPAFRFNLLTIIASIFLFSDNSFSPMIPAIFLLVYGSLVRLFGPMVYGGNFNQGDIMLALLTSGTLFCSVFLIQWWGTTPISVAGKMIFGAISGVLAFVIIGCGTSPIGMIYTVLIGNIVNMIIRHIEERKNNIMLEKVALKAALRTYLRTPGDDK